MLATTDDRLGTFDWNTDDWDSVDWTTFWDRQRAALRGLDPRAFAAGPVPRHRRALLSPSDAWSRDTIADTVERLTARVLDNTLPWVADRFGPHDAGADGERSTIIAVREVWCHAAGHWWTRPVVGGRLPAACPEHDVPLDPCHPSAEGSCFRAEGGWALRVRVGASVGWDSEIQLPEALAAAIGVAPQRLLELRPGNGRGPVLRLWRGRRDGWVRGDIEALLPVEARAGDMLFVSFVGLRYSVMFTSPSRTSPPVVRVAALVGLPASSAALEEFV
jgi:hypothetical protein